MVLHAHADRDSLVRLRFVRAAHPRNGFWTDGTHTGHQPCRPSDCRARARHLEPPMERRRHGSTVALAARSRSPRATTGGARAMWALALVFMAIALLTTRSSGPNGGPLFAIVGVLAILPAVTVGTILVTRLPANRIGWLLLVGGLLFAVSGGVSGLADFGLNVHPGSVPGAVWLAWLSGWIVLPFVVLALVYLPLLFPTGRLPSRRWRLVAIAGAVALVVGSVGSAFTAFTPGTYPPSVQNPLAVSGTIGDLLSLGGTVVVIVIIAVVFLAMASLVVRYRRAVGVERQQLKWFAAVIAIAGPALATAFLTSGATSGVIADVSNAAWGIALISLALLPLAIGLAVLRYRLYEIDRLISRTISYGVVTLVLASLFVVVVLAARAVLGPLTGSSTIAVAGSTLLVAALFQPIRRRVQRVVDRRFNRSRYDAERTVAAFAGRLRDEVDLDALRAEILATVSAAVEPSSVSLWLRE
jgi:hypothetical protein